MGEIASVLLTMGTGGAGGAGAAGMTAMATGSGVEGAAGATLGGTAAGGIGAGLGEVAATPESAAAFDLAGGTDITVAGGAQDAIAAGVEPGAEVANDMIIAEPAESAPSSSGFGLNDVKDFFSQTWDNAKNDLGKNVVRDADGSINAGKTAGNFGYGIAKSALLKAINAKDQEMPNPNQDQPQPMKFSQPEAVNAEDELNRLRNRMNVS